MVKNLQIFIFLFLTGNAVFGQDDNSSFLIPYRESNLWGYSDTLGNIKIKPSYDSVTFFFSKRPSAIVCKGNKCGIIDTTGNLLLPLSKDLIIPNEVPGLYITKRGNLFGLFDCIKKTVIAKEIYDSIRYYKEAYFFVQKDQKKGILDPEGRNVVPIIYDRFLETYFFPVYRSERNCLIGEIKGDYFLVERSDGSSKPIPNPGKEEIGLFQKKNEIKSPVDEKSLKAKLEDLITAYQLDSVSVMPPNHDGYDFITHYKVYKKGKVGVWQQNGEIVKPSFDEVIKVKVRTHKEFYIYVVNKGIHGIIDQNGKAIVPFMFDTLLDFTQKCVVTVLNHKRGFYIFDTIYPPVNNLYEEITIDRFLKVNSGWSFIIFRVVKDGKLGYVGENGVEYFK